MLRSSLVSMSALIFGECFVAKEVSLGRYSSLETYRHVPSPKAEANEANSRESRAKSETERQTRRVASP